ncbi:MAG: HEAT repeat domain-containing protein [Promethearchaeota archaeon]
MNIKKKVEIEHQISELINRLKQKINDRTSNFREKSNLVQKIAAIKSWKILEPLENLVKGAKIKVSDDLRVKVLEELAKFGDPRVIKILTEHIKDKNSSIRVAAVKGLSMIQNPKCIQPLMESIDNEEKWVRIFAIHGLYNNINKNTVQYIIERFGDNEMIVREEAIKSIEGLSPEIVGEALINALNSENRFIELGAASLLGKKKFIRFGEIALNNLIKLLNVNDKRLKIIVGRTLSNIADPNAIPNLLILALEDGGIESIYAHMIYDMKKIEPLIRLTLIAENDNLKELIVNILKKFGQDAIKAVIRISEQENDKNKRKLNDLLKNL